MTTMAIYTNIESVLMVKIWELNRGAKKMPLAKNLERVQNKSLNSGRDVVLKDN